MGIAHEDKRAGALSQADQTSVAEDVPLESVALDRLIEEVRTEEVAMGRHYNRTYNRHNR